MKQDPALQLRGFLLDIVGLCALTLVLESSLRGVSDVADGDSLSVNFGIAWHEDDETANDLPASDHHQRQNATADNDYELINDSNLSERLRCCPGVDIFQPFGLRGNGYCEDAVAYAKYLDSRLLPM
ncbi:hypothetical protein PC118_g13497 [Phytophthora cactorum]|uniref:Uncharacterized protein n=1 Tax=Phytophthora cactorum TaxID=29920 RepID=A0A8T1FWT6_9STRA|nr:hypothetical protein PC115_g10540 [Phytophthora cactorum]KAG2976280.1 hypothetical protein PC118_g13497 [Phytophthora cactorum]KAG3007707.1 hypothetical protein PC119_g14484 [Phytophthora cactorum]